MERSGYAVCGGTFMPWGEAGKKNSSQAQGVARVPARKEAHVWSVPRIHNSCPTLQCWGSHWDLRRQGQSEAFSLKESGGRLSSDWLVSQVEKDAPLRFINRKSLKRMETGWGVSTQKQCAIRQVLQAVFTQNGAKMGKLARNNLLWPLRKKKKKKDAFYILQASFARFISSRTLSNQVGTSPGKRKTAFESLALGATHLPMIINGNAAATPLLHWLLALSIHMLLRYRHCHPWRPGWFSMELSLPPA